MSYYTLEIYSTLKVNNTLIKSNDLQELCRIYNSYLSQAPVDDTLTMSLRMNQGIITFALVTFYKGTYISFENFKRNEVLDIELENL